MRLIIKTSQLKLIKRRKLFRIHLKISKRLAKFRFVKTKKSCKIINNKNQKFQLLNSNKVLH